MIRVDRVKAALAKEEVDRVPISIWRHFSAIDQDPKTLAITQAEFNEKYDFDFIKMMPFGQYPVQDWGCQVQFFSIDDKYPIITRTPIHALADWEKIEVLPAHYGTYGKQVQFTRYLQEIVGETVPYIQTIFSPLATATKLAGRRIYSDMLDHPDVIHRALKVIAETTINFIKENIRYGVAGFFFATQQACYDIALRDPATNTVQHDRMTWEQYKEFGRKYDLMVLEEATSGTWFNVLHIHGANTMFKELLDYPVQVLNWHDRMTYPTLKEARALTDKCLLGGIADMVSGAYEAISQGTPEEVTEQIKEAILQAGNKGLMIGPGCIVRSAPEKNLFAARKAVELL